MPSFKNSRESSGTQVALSLALAAVVVHEEAESPCDGSAAHCRMLVWKNHAPVRRAHSLASVADSEISKGADLFFLLLSSKKLRGAQGRGSIIFWDLGGSAVSALASPRACVFFLKKLMGFR